MYKFNETTLDIYKLYNLESTSTSGAEVGLGDDRSINIGGLDSEILQMSANKCVRSVFLHGGACGTVH